MSEHPDLVPCSNCGAPVLTNLAECMFCQQKDPGKMGATAIGRSWLQLKFKLRRQRRQVERTVRGVELPSWAQPLHEAGAVTTRLIIVCVALYMAALVFDALGSTSGSFLSPSSEILIRMGMAGRGAFITGRPWGLITAIYLHGGFLHLLMNMVVLWRFGHSVEMLFGRNQYFLIFTLSGLVGTLLTTLLGTPYSVGASGAIFGLLGALVIYWMQDGSPYAKQMMQQIAIFAIVTFLLGASTPNTDNYGHLGGFLGGLGVAYALRLSPLYAGHPFFTRAAQACLFLTIAAFTLSIAIPTG